MDDFIRKFLKHRKFSNNIVEEVAKKTAKTTAEQEMEHRLQAEAMTKMAVNEMMPTFRKMMEREEEARKKAKEPRKIIIPD
jgi:roadblock/LC7 domain-containing protein